MEQNKRRSMYNRTGISELLKGDPVEDLIAKLGASCYCNPMFVHSICKDFFKSYPEVLEYYDESEILFYMKEQFGSAY